MNQPTPHPAWLAQSHGAQAATDAVLVLGALIVLVVVGGFLVMHLRRRFLAGSDAEAPGLLLDDLRALRASGQISDEEYERARAALVARMGRAPGARPDAAGSSPGLPPAPRTPGAQSPPRPASPAPPDPTLRVAPPGYDLTGAPLPRPAPPEQPQRHPPRPEQ